MMKSDSQWTTDPYCIMQNSYYQHMPSYDPNIIPKIKQFIQQLECPDTKAMGIEKYWVGLSQLIYRCSQPAIVLRTFDGYDITFIIAKGMIKLSGLAHTLKNKSTGEKQKCFDCTYKISKIFREVILPGFGLSPTILANDQNLRKQYQCWKKDNNSQRINQK